jgi:hypothetical protein
VIGGERGVKKLKLGKLKVEILNSYRRERRGAEVSPRPRTMDLGPLTFSAGEKGKTES